MKFKVPWPLVSERVVKFFTPLSVFYKDCNKECPMPKFVQFFKCSFGEIYCQP